MKCDVSQKTATQKAIEALSEDIYTGRYSPYMSMPTEATLCKRFKLSRMTIRNVLARLEEKGLIYRQQGRGTFVYPLKQIQVKPVVLLLRESQKAVTPYMNEICHGANSYLNSIGSHISIKSSSPCEWSRKFINSISGVIVIPTCVSSEDMDAISALGLSHVIMMESDLAGPTVKMCPMEAAEELVKGLLTLGHRKFAIISGHDEHGDRQKRMGIKKALAEADIDIKSVPDYRTNYEPVQAELAAGRILQSACKPTAIIAFDDTLAIITISTASRLGLAVPGDISVTGFNDASFSALINPPLSTVRFPALQAGNLAAKSICESFLSNRMPEDINIGHEIIWRGSTGPAN